MDGPLPSGAFYSDSKPPFYVTSGSAISLTTTYAAYVPTGACPFFGENYFTPGKLIYIRIVYQMTTAATPGALFVNLLWGSNANNTGQSLVSTGLNLTANQTNTVATNDFWVRCRSVAAGTANFLAWGTLFVGGSGAIPIPWNNLAVATNIDTTLGGYIIPQYNRSGSTAETFLFHDIYYRAMN